MLSLDVEAGFPDSAFELRAALEAGPEPLALAGPSGAGKTSLLRIIAGLLRPSRGTVRCDGIVWFDADGRVEVPTERRSCGYVFQDYALFPHLRAWENVAFGIVGAGAERRARAHELLERFGLGERGDARPASLSGGERQRVAIARALATRPRLLLLDEPLAALDPGTRLRAGRELASTIAAAQVPVVLVTHDFTEAATLAGDIAVLEGGRIAQRGTPHELASAPASAFVADFTGASVLSGVARDGPAGLTAVELDGGGSVLSTDRLTGPVVASVHPWEISLEPLPSEAHGSAQNRLTARVVAVVPLGSRVRVSLETPQFLSAEVTAPAVEALGLRAGVVVVASWKATATRLAER